MHEVLGVNVEDLSGTVRAKRDPSAGRPEPAREHNAYAPELHVSTGESWFSRPASYSRALGWFVLNTSVSVTADGRRGVGETWLRIGDVLTREPRGLMESVNDRLQPRRL